jgi:hypothetical protein
MISRRTCRISWRVCRLWIGLLFILVMRRRIGRNMLVRRLFRLFHECERWDCPALEEGEV